MLSRLGENCGEPETCTRPFCCKLIQLQRLRRTPACVDNVQRLDVLPYPSEYQSTLAAQPDVAGSAPAHISLNCKLGPSPAPEPQRKRGLTLGDQGKGCGNRACAAGEGLALDASFV